MRVTIDIQPYNSRRYGKPWIAHVSFNGPKLIYDFSNGSYLGDEAGGKLYIECTPGDVIASGQKDNRSGKNTENILYIVQNDGVLQQVDKVSAFEHWETQRTAPIESRLANVSTDDLIAELHRRGYQLITNGEEE
ncbi:hypothetical protein EHV15_34730 [Paenibacillus oralis]|uniref:Uncharacterized protein n=1 Tax=Paenibacillus oralis TaxID=2490856 RepID=A0A3P3T9N8_9BACL|nr:hypothetical protein [Paenibacillus oralis]RRJ54751.1 hypothetical protein EHV15_34730 [Paenibacillus oralis]